MTPTTLYPRPALHPMSMSRATSFRPLAAALCAALFALGTVAALPAAAAEPAKPGRAAKPGTPRGKAPAAAPALEEATPEQVAAAGYVYYGVYDCEFKQSVEVETSTRHPHYVDLRFGKSAWLMKPVLSSTGAIRLEDVRGETLMVQIASKSMLMNVRSGTRMVDECISPTQRELIARAKQAAEAAAVKAAADAASSPETTTLLR